MKDRNDLLARMMEATKSKNEAALANTLGVSQQALYNAKKKWSFPSAWIMEIATRHNISLDWLYFGEGHMHRGELTPSSATPEALDKALLLEAIETVEEFLKDINKSLPAKNKAEVIYQLYNLVLEENGTATADGNSKPIRMFKLIKGAFGQN